MMDNFQVPDNMCHDYGACNMHTTLRLYHEIHDNNNNYDNAQSSLIMVYNSLRVVCMSQAP